MLKTKCTNEIDNSVTDSYQGPTKCGTRNRTDTATSSGWLHRGCGEFVSNVCCQVIRFAPALRGQTEPQVKEIQEEDIDELGLPFATTKVFKKKRTLLLANLERGPTTDAEGQDGDQGRGSQPGRPG